MELNSLAFEEAQYSFGNKKNSSELKNNTRKRAYFSL